MANQFSQSAQNWLSNKPSSGGVTPINSTFSSQAQSWLSTNTGQPSKPSPKQPLDIGKSFSSGGLQLHQIGSAGLTPDAQKVVDKEIQKQKDLNKQYQAVQNIPEVHFADKENFWTPVGFVKSIAQGLLNTPQEAIKGSASLGMHAGTGTSTPQEVAGDVASIVQLPLLFLGGGEAESVAKTALQQGFKGVVKTIGNSVITGGAFGFLGGLQSGKNITNASDYVKNLAENVGIGAATGGILGGLTHVVLPLAKGAGAKVGAVFVKNIDKNPTIEHIQVDPKLAQSVVLGNNEISKSPIGKAIVKESFIAQENNQQVGIKVNPEGKYALPDGRHADVISIPVYNPEKIVDEAKSEPRTNTEQSPQTIEPQQGKRVLNTKEVSALKTVIDDKLKHIRENSGTPEELSRDYESLYKTVTDQANNDKVVLSALRTKINEEMYGLAGAVGDSFKENHAQLKLMMKEDPDIGPVLGQLEYYVNELDDKLLRAQEPARIKPNLSQEKTKVVKQEVVANQEPVGTGKTKESRAFARFTETLKESDPKRYQELKDGKITYNQLSLKQDAENAMKLVEKDPNQAYRIAKGLEAAPQGQTETAISIALADRASREGDYAKQAELESARSLRQTRRGQEIVSERGRFSDTSPYHYIQELMDTRLKKLGKSLIGQIKDQLPGDKMSEKKAAVERIDQETKNLKNILTREQSKIKLAQNILDSLTCK